MSDDIVALIFGLQAIQTIYNNILFFFKYQFRQTL